MTEWRLRPISDLCSHIVDCVNKTAPISDTVTPFKMLRTTNVRDGWIDASNTRRVDKATYERWTRRMRPQRGDIVLTREAPLGEVGMLRSDDPVFLGQRLVMYRADPTECDSYFLLYSMLGPIVQAELRSLGSGATVEHLRVPDCEKLMIPCPDLAIQQRIGAVLSALDALIENNRRRIAVLEEMVRSIYREWFIRFRYPGHQAATIVDSSFGLIPEGWEPTAASHALVVNPRMKLDKSTHPFITMGDLSERSMVCFASDEKTGSSGSKFLNGDTLFARITPCLENGKTGFVQCLKEGQQGLGSTEFIVLRGNTVGPAYTYCLARSEEFRAHAIQSMSGASGRQRVRNECFDSLLLAVPPPELGRAYEGLATPLFETIHTLMVQAAALNSARNLLLPKLVTGQIEVSSLNLQALVKDSVV